jgi:glycerol-3-phosphate dehydrogenase (NAD(P)+)
MTLDEAVAEVGQVAEGVNTLQVVIEHARDHGIYMPLASSLYEILFNDSTIEQEIGLLMGGASNADVEFVTGV